MTALNFAIGLALTAIVVILTGAPDWVVALLLGLFWLAGFLALASAGDQVGESE